MRAIARDTRRTFSDTVADLMQRGLNPAIPAAVSPSPRNGLPVVTLGSVVSTDVVRAVDDEE